MVMFLMSALAIMSCVPAYWPMEPMEMPWELRQVRFSMRMFVEFGFRETQSSPLVMVLFVMVASELR